MPSGHFKFFDKLNNNTFGLWMDIQKNNFTINLAKIIKVIFNLYLSTYTILHFKRFSTD